MAEKKYLDVSQLYGPPPLIPVFNTGILFNVTNLLGQGFTNRTRIGDKVTGTSLEIRLNAFSPQDVDTSLNFMTWRVIAFIWKDDTAPVTADILDVPSAANAIYPFVQIYPWNHDKKIKRKILCDIQFNQYNDVDVTVGTISGVSSPIVTKKLIIPLTKLGSLATVNFQNNTVTGVNHIYIIAVSNLLGTQQTAAWNLAMYVRYNFIDV